MLPLGLLLAGALPSGLSVSVEASTPCLLELRLVPALTRWLPGIEVRSGGKAPGRAGELSIALAPLSSSALRLRLLEDGQREVLGRELLVPAAEGCPALADQIALIVERYLSDLGYQPPAATLPLVTVPPPVRPVPPVPPVPASSGATVAAPRASSTGTTTAGPTPTRGSLSLELDAGLALGGEIGVRSNGDVVFGTPIAWARLQLGQLFFGIRGAGLWPPVQRSFFRGSIEQGSIRLWSLELLAELGTCFGDQLRLCPKLEAGPGWVYAKNDGGLFNQVAPAALLEPLLGLALDTELRLKPWFSVLISIGALERPRRPAIEVTGGPTTYVSPELSLTFGLGALVRIL